MTIKRKHISIRRRQLGGEIVNISNPNIFTLIDGQEYNILEVDESYTFEGLAVAIVSYQNCGMNCVNPPNVTYRWIRGTMKFKDVHGYTYEYEGTFYENEHMKQGKLTINDVNGNTYETYDGTFDENGNKKNGTLIKSVPTGIYYKKTTYTGPFEDGKMSGVGEMILEDGSTYTGNFNNDLFHGKGNLSASDGSTYTGNFKNDLFHGEGTLKCRSGNIIFRGQWIDGKMHNGTGRYEMPNGNVYNGNFQHGKTHGEGTMYYKDGRIYIGTWKNGKPENGKIYKPNANTAHIIFINGRSSKL